jgi:hypothetical protein
MGWFDDPVFAVDVGEGHVQLWFKVHFCSMSEKTFVNRGSHQRRLKAIIIPAWIIVWNGVVIRLQDKWCFFSG